MRLQQQQQQQWAAMAAGYGPLAGFAPSSAAAVAAAAAAAYSNPAALFDPRELLPLLFFIGSFEFSIIYEIVAGCRSANYYGVLFYTGERLIKKGEARVWLT